MSPEPLPQVGEAAGEAEHRHHLARHDDVEAGLARIAVVGSAEPDHDVAQRTIVDVEHAPPGDPAHVDVERVAALDVIVDEGGQQVRRHRDRREVAREVEVDVLHRHDLRVAAARGTALHAEHRTEGGLAQADRRPSGRSG